MDRSIQKIKILVVDDNPENIWPLIEELEGEFEMLTATSGQKALDLVFSPERPDLILLDVMMPGLDGYEVCKRLKADQSSCTIPVIFLTGKDEVQEEVKGLELGAHDYITKPFSSTIVRARIKGILALKKEMDRRLLLKTNMEELNDRLELQVEQKQLELSTARESLQTYEDKYHVLFGSQSSESSQRTILVVDDNPENIHVLVESLESDYDVLFATSGQKALDIAFSSERPDLILLDIMMPDMDGYEVCARLKADAETWDIPIIFVSAMDQEFDETKGLQLGAVDYVTKPFSIAVVQARVRSALQLKAEMDNRLQLAAKLEDMNETLEQRIQERTVELEQAYEDLRLSEKRYRAIYENAVEGIFQASLDGCLRAASPALARILGFDTAEELCFQEDGSCQQLFADPEDRKKFQELLEHQGAITHFETRIQKKDGETTWCDINAKMVQDESQDRYYVQGFVTDITGQRQAEAENIELEEQLRQAQKMEAIGTLAGGIAHDFNNILSAIYGYAELATLKLINETEACEDIGQVLAAADRAKALVAQILTFSRRAEKELQPLQIQLVVKEALKLLRASIPTTIGLDIDIEEDCGLVLADPTQIHQIMMNLCTNAYHAMEESGGVLGVTMVPCGLQGNYIGEHALPPGPYLRLTISDTGCGMSRSTLDRIFEPYFTTKDKGKGTGLGLAVVHGIIKAYGGSIEVESVADEGTTFTIYLPRVTQTQPPPVALQKSVTQGKQEHILVVDDEEMIVEMLTEMLQQLGYRVTATTDSLEALQLFTRDSETFDLVITDMTMPQMTGVELAKEMLDVKADLPIILCTGWSDQFSQEAIWALGIKVYLSKPVTRLMLSQAVRTALEEDVKS